jgi:YidC/Oxa1 family membrane protein insertase
MLIFMLYLSYQESRYEEAAPGSPTAESPDVGPDGKPQESAQATPEGFESRASEPRSPSIAADPMDSKIESALQPLAVPAPSVARWSATLENANVVAKISNEPELISSWHLKKHEERLSDGAVPIELVSNGQPILRTDVAGLAGVSFAGQRFEVVSSSQREVVQRATNSAGVLTRILRLDPEGYGFDLELSFESRRQDPVEAEFEVFWPVHVSERPDFRELSLLAFGAEEGVHRELVAGVGQPGFFGRFMGESATGVEEVEGLARWAGFDIRYFTGVVVGPGDQDALRVRFEALESGKSAQARITLPGVAVGSGGNAEKRLRGFFGPKEPEALASAGAGLEHTINRGWSWLEPLTRLFEIALVKLYAVIPNYGLAIIVLTILVRIVVSPLMVRQMRSAEKMRAVQPRVKALQEKYKEDRQKQSEEMMKLWREEGINPLGGCLPVLFQFPVLIGLFYALQSSFALRHAPFMLWIDDLSQPATLFTLPGLDFPIRVLPIVMAGSMFVQQKMTPTTGMDPAQARMMLIMMPAMMLLISYTFPSGLVLYWTVSNLLGIGHQYWIRSKMEPAS